MCLLAFHFTIFKYLVFWYLKSFSASPSFPRFYILYRFPKFAFENYWVNLSERQRTIELFWNNSQLSPLFLVFILYRFPNFAFENYWVNLSERQRTIVAIIEVSKCLFQTDWFCKRAKRQNCQRETSYTYSKFI